MIAWTDATTLLMRMVGTLLDEGTAPARIVTSRYILENSGWMRSASLADDGTLHLLGMFVVETAMDVLHVDDALTRSYLDDGDSRVHVYRKAGVLYLGV